MLYPIISSCPLTSFCSNFLSMLQFVHLVAHNDLAFQVFVQSPPWARIKFRISPTVLGRTTSYHAFQVSPPSDSDQQSFSLKTGFFLWVRLALNLICHFITHSCCFLMSLCNSFISVFILPTLKNFLPSSDLVDSLLTYFSRWSMNTHILAQSPPTASDLPLMQKITICS